MADLLPVCCRIATWQGPFVLHAPFPSEARLLERMVPKRRAEFTTGRRCARRALEALGVKPIDLPPDERRRVVWPVGFVGSITHTDGFCAAVAAPLTAIAGVGLDAERISRIGEDLWPLILTPSEAERILAPGDHGAQAYAALLFSAKEAFFKAQHPLTDRWLDFADVEVIARDGALEIRCPKTPDVAGSARGRYRLIGDLVITAVWLTLPT